jgi:hypothetical protein
MIYAAKASSERDPALRRELMLKAWDSASAALQADPNFEAAKKLLDILRKVK